jgi:hypothetical protein
MSWETTKLNDFTKKHFETLSVRLFAWQKFLGVSNTMDEEQELEIVGWLKEFFGDFSTEEIDRAIKLAAARELNLKDTEHYNQFGSQYLGKVLPAYRIFRGNVSRQYNKAIEAKRGLIPEEKTVAELTRSSIESAAVQFTEWQKTGKVRDVNNVTYKFLVKKGFLEVSEEEYAMAESEATGRLLTEATNLSLTEMDPGTRAQSKSFIEALQNNLESATPKRELETRRILLARHFEGLHNRGTNIVHFLKEKLKRDLNDQTPCSFEPAKKGAANV